MKIGAISFFAILCMFFSTNGLAKKFCGTVVDEKQSPVRYVTVTALGDSIPTAATLTDSLGNYALQASPSTKYLRFSLMGFEPKTLDVTTGTFPDTVILKQADNVLKEVVVTGSALTFKSNRFILNLDSDPFSKGKDMSQVLQTAPGVWLDRHTMSVLGKGGTQVYINDRRIKLTGEQLYNYLQAIPASSVARVEIIPVAGAEYSASFDGGIVKIILKKRGADGHNGNISFKTRGGERNLAFTPSFNLAFNKGKLTLNLLTSLPVSPYSKSTFTEFAENYSAGSSIQTSNKRRSHSFTPNVLATATIDLDNKNSIGIETECSFDNGHSRTDSRSSISYAPSLAVSFSQGRYSSRHSDKRIDTRINYDRILDQKNSSLKVLGSLTYKESRSTENNEFREAETDSIYDVDLDADVTNVNGEIRWQGNFSKAISLTAGLKHTFNFVKNRARHLYLKEVDMTAAPQFDYDARYNENITALYFSLPMEFGKVSIEAGMRGELYKASGSGLDRSETGLFPTIGLSLSLLRNGNLTASANYSRKVKRPTFWQQSPLVRQFSDYTYTVGNLHLHSSVTNSVSLNFIIVKKITLGTSYSNLSNPIRQLFSTDPRFPERLYLTYGNTGHEHNVNVYVIGRLSPVKNWIIGGTFILLDQFREKVPGDRLSSNLVFQGQAYSFLSLPKGFSISANGYYYSPMQIGNITTCPIADLSITVNKTMGKGWNIALSADNILQLKNGNTSRDTGFYRKSQSKGYACVSVTFSYSFKSGKPVKKKKVINNVDASRLRQE